MQVSLAAALPMHHPSLIATAQNSQECICSIDIVAAHQLGWVLATGIEELETPHYGKNPAVLAETVTPSGCGVGVQGCLTPHFSETWTSGLLQLLYQYSNICISDLAYPMGYPYTKPVSCTASIINHQN